MTPVTHSTHPSEMWQGFWGIQVLHAGQSLGLFEALLDQKTVEAVSCERGLDPRYVSLWCEAAASYGLLQSSNGEFRTTPEYAEWLQRSRGFTFTHLHLARRTNETLAAVFGGRALPEPQISLRFLLQENLQANYEWLYQEVTAASPELEERMLREGRALEVGCGVGFGLSYLRDFYPNLELFGLETDYECAQEAERTTRAVIHVGELPRDRFTRGFDLIVCFRSLSAAKDPTELLRRCAGLLVPDGFFLLGSETIDNNKRRKCEARVQGERMAYNILAGESLINSFTQEELRNMLSESGLKIMAEIEAPDWATPAILCQPRT